MSMLPVVSRSGICRRILNLNNARSYAAGYWNKDWMPGPVPRTEQERVAAAKKYGLIPEDYKTYPDDGFGYGDYPNLPIVSEESRDQFYNWDFDESKRNFGEPIHVDVDMYGADRIDYNKRRLYSLNFQMAFFLGFMGTMFLLVLTIGEKYKFTLVKKMPKQYPYQGKTHYTFDLED